MHEHFIAVIHGFVTTAVIHGFVTTAEIHGFVTTEVTLCIGIPDWF